MKLLSITALLFGVLTVASGQTASPTPSPTEPTEVLVQDVTTVKVKATAFDKRTKSQGGCKKNGGCKPKRVLDGRIKDQSRWSCTKLLADPKQCILTLKFKKRQDVTNIGIAFYKGDERTRSLKILENKDLLGYFTSSGDTEGIEYTGFRADNVKRLRFESIGLDRDEWISITEVKVLVAA